MCYAGVKIYFVSVICNISSSSVTMVSTRCSDSRQQLQYAPSQSQTYRCGHTEHLHPIVINRPHDIKCFLSNFITVLFHTSLYNGPYQRWVLDVVKYGLAIGSRLSYYLKPAHRSSLRICCVILPIAFMSCLTSIADGFVLTASSNMVKIVLKLFILNYM